MDGGLAAGVVRQRAAGWRAVGGSLECLDLSSMCHTNVLKPTRMILMVVIEGGQKYTLEIYKIGCTIFFT